MMVTKMTTYGSTEIQRLAKISKMQAIHWTQIGAVIPFRDAKGRGSRRMYSWQNLIEMLICRELNKFTVETRVMVGILEYLRDSCIRTQKGMVSFWELLQKEPETDRVFLSLIAVTAGGGSPLRGGYGVSTYEELKAGLKKNQASALIINVRGLIDEVGGA